MNFTEEDFIEPEPDRSEDETYDSGHESDTTSLSSSILDYQYENGRRYHGYKSGKYIMPNDETEQDRLDMFHHLSSILLGGRNYLAPLKNPQRILDIGTGTGIWALDMAEEFPSAEVIGTDLSPIQPTWVFPNVRFLVDDAEVDWAYAPDSFDFIHLRTMVGSIQNWPRLLNRVYKHLRPGGYVEMADFPTFYPACDDQTYTSDSCLWRYHHFTNKASAKRGIALTFDKPCTDLVSDAGFEVVVNKSFKVPYSMWPADKRMKERGKWMQLLSQTGFEAYGLALFTRELGMSKEDATELIEGCKKEVNSKKIHTYFTVQHVVGRKPLSDSEL